MLGGERAGSSCVILIVFFFSFLSFFFPFIRLYSAVKMSVGGVVILKWGVKGQLLLQYFLFFIFAKIGPRRYVRSVQGPRFFFCILERTGDDHHALSFGIPSLPLVLGL